MTMVAPAMSPRATMPSPAGWTLWGASAQALHDRVWALRQIQVVRPGGAAPDQRGPRQFLLVEPEALVDFPARRAMDKLYWSKARAVRLRFVERSGQSYAETVDCDGAGRLLRIRRDYSSVASTTARCWLTSDIRLARVWHDAAPQNDPQSGPRATPGARAWARLTDKVGAGETIALRVEGRLCAGTNPEQCMAWLEAMPDAATDLEHAFESVYLYQPGVWAHESASVPPTTRFAGAAMVGAGVDLTGVPVVVGPVILGDETMIEPPVEFDWRGLETPTHRLLPRPRLRRGWTRRASKRGFDIAVSGSALLCFLPVFPLVMLLIFLEDGRPFFFAHVRQTRGGREFPCLKFRTMVNGAEGLKDKLKGANQSDGAHFFIKNDPRLLKIGRWLRRFQIDEVPQFWNILLGHMSLVGPRPSPDRENQFCPAWREARLSVRPGLTGLWQVRRTREPQTDFQEWIRYDLEYVQRESWRLDLWIMLETIRTVVLGGRVGSAGNGKKSSASPSSDAGAGGASEIKP